MRFGKMLADPTSAIRHGHFTRALQEQLNEILELNISNFSSSRVTNQGQVQKRQNCLWWQTERRSFIESPIIFYKTFLTFFCYDNLQRDLPHKKRSEKSCPACESTISRRNIVKYSGWHL